MEILPFRPDPWWGEGLEYLLNLFSYNQLASDHLMKEEPFDLLISHDWLALPGGMAARRSGTPLDRSCPRPGDWEIQSPNPELMASNQRARMLRTWL